MRCSFCARFSLQFISYIPCIVLAINCCVYFFSVFDGRCLLRSNATGGVDENRINTNCIYRLSSTAKLTALWLQIADCFHQIIFFFCNFFAIFSAVFQYLSIFFSNQIINACGICMHAHCAHRVKSLNESKQPVQTLTHSPQWDRFLLVDLVSLVLLMCTQHTALIWRHIDGRNFHSKTSEKKEVTKMKKERKRNEKNNNDDDRKKTCSRKVVSV